MGSQCYLPSGRGDIPAFTPAKAGTRFGDPGGMQGWVDLVDQCFDTIGFEDLAQSEVILEKKTSNMKINHSSKQ